MTPDTQAKVIALRGRRMKDTGRRTQDAGRKGAGCGADAACILSAEAGPPPPAQGSRSQTVGRHKGVENKNSLKIKS